MDQKILRKFVREFRKTLMNDMEHKAKLMGITKDCIADPIQKGDGFETFSINGSDNFTLYGDDIIKRKKLVQEIENEEFYIVLEDIINTWFNKIIAIRFMEVNNYLPTKTRVLSSEIPDKSEPDILTNALDIDLNLTSEDKENIFNLKEKNQFDELYKFLFLKQCNKLNDILPELFKKEDDYADLLFDISYVKTDGIVQAIDLLPEEYFKNQTEIIGLLFFYINDYSTKELYYSPRTDSEDYYKDGILKYGTYIEDDIKYKFYIEDGIEYDVYVEDGIEHEVYVEDGFQHDVYVEDGIKHEETYEFNLDYDLCCKRGINYDLIRTQLYSPEWLVHYLVDNSLGKYWIEKNSDSSLEEKLKYYIKYQKKGKLGDDIPVEQLKFFDPFMGSGQILCYAFDVFYQIYLELGYLPEQIPELILKNNLYGLDIDDRAYQLAYFSVMMKAKSYDSEIFNKNLKLNLSSIHDSYIITDEIIEFIEEKSKNLAKTMKNLKKVFKNAQVLGSLIQAQKIDVEKLDQDYNEFLSDLKKDSISQKNIENIKNIIGTFFNQTKLLNLKYDFVVTDIGLNSLNRYSYDPFDGRLSNIERTYISFMSRNFMFCKQYGYVAMITERFWMFLENYERLRKYLLEEKSIESLIHLQRFFKFQDELISCAFVMENSPSNSLGTYISLTDFKGDMDIQEQKFLEAASTKTDYVYFADNKQFTKNQGNSLIYWVNDSLNSLENKNLFDFADIEKGDIISRYNLWYEVSINDIYFDNCDESKINSFNWFPYNENGSIFDFSTFRKWYGNQRYVVYKNDEVEQFIKKGQDIDTSLFKKESITWLSINLDLPSFRLYPKGFVLSKDSISIFVHDNNNNEYLLGLLNSSFSQKYVNFFSHRSEYPISSVDQIPVIKNENFSNEIKMLVNENIELCKNDWDDYETSWNFKTNPLIRFKRDTLCDSFKAWEEHKLNDFNQLKANEERLNEIFAEIYSVDVNCKVENEHVSITKADYEKDIKDLISYAVGCMFGRYSLDDEGTICAGDNFNMENYSIFRPDYDGIILISEKENFQEDIVDKFIEFIKSAFGEDHLNENLDFIANALNKKGKNNIEKIRKYFLFDFYKDHIKKYNKLPIYWQFNSGRYKGIRCFTYYHRYHPTLVSEIRTEYLHKIQKTIEDNIDRCDNIIESNSTKKTDKNKSQKEKDKLFKQLDETRVYDEALAHIANQQIELDLDDGIMDNYKKFQSVPVEIDGHKTKKINLLTKVTTKY